MPEEAGQFPKLSSVAKQIFDDIKNANRVTDDQLASLHLLFGGHFDKAAEIVDQGAVYAFVGKESQRKVYKVHARRGKSEYTVFPRHFCSCQSFFFDVASKGEAVYCKHQLAVSLAEALNLIKPTTVDDLVIAELLQSQT